MFCYHNCSKIETKYDWVRWIEQLKSDPNDRFGLEFVEGWDGIRIVVLGAVVLLLIVGLSAIWAFNGGELQTVFTVMGFTLSVTTGKRVVRFLGDRII